MKECRRQLLDSIFGDLANGFLRATPLGEYAQMQQLFESWSAPAPLIPPRTPAYALEPLGIGTGLTESLSSYIIRLAEVHSVTVGDFVGRLLSEIPNPNGAIVTPAAPASRAGSHGFRACSYAINGTTERTARWVYALEAVTGRPDLRYLTLLSFRSALPRQVFRHYRAWCPACLEHWRAVGQTLYEPLAWASDLSSCCPLHKHPLCSTCHHCGCRLSPLGVISRIGYCQHCGGWLGQSVGDPEPAQDHAASRQKLWASEQISELLTTLPRVNPQTSRRYFRESLTVYLEKVVGGNIAALAEYVHCPRSILQNWLDGKAMPRLESQLRIAWALNVSISSFFIREVPIAVDIAAAKHAITVAGRRNVSPSRTSDQIRKVLRVALKDNAPTSLSDVARTLGYTTTERLYRADRKLCHRIAGRYRQSGGSHWWRRPGAARICDVSRLKEILQESLRSHEPASVHHIAARLGYPNDGYIQQKFPELCAAISRRIAGRRQVRLDEIRQTLEKALQEHPAPTLAELTRRLGCTTSSILRMHQPDLCNQLLARYRTSIDERRSGLRKAAESALDETPVPSLRSVCERLGITAWFMNQYFPDVRRRISEQHRRCSLAETARRRELLFEAVRNIATDVHSRGLYPSAARIAERIPGGLRCEWMILNTAVHQARKALGFSS
jgi:AraC-like DNA-binding protein